MTLTPAYGRDYKSKAAAVADFDANKDFVEAMSGQYINKEQVKAAGLKQVMIRYGQLRKVAPVKVT